VVLVVLALGLIAIGWAGEWRNPLNGDAAWTLYVAKGIFRGQQLYRDIVDLNPPLVFWLNLPIVGLASLLHLSESSAYRITVVLVTAASLWFCARLIGSVREHGGWPGAPGLLLLFLFVSVTMTIGYFGQREHLLLVLSLPYLCVLWYRAEGWSVSAHRAALAGLLAAFGIALKPYFILFWFATAAYGWLATRGRPVWRDSEHLVIAGFHVIYVAAVWTFAPSYLEVVRRWGPTYLEFARKPMAHILVRDVHPLTIVAALAIYPLSRLARYRRLAGALASASAGLLLAALIQQKGFGYHFYPGVAVAMVLLGLFVLVKNDSRYPLAGATTRVLAVVIFTACAGLFLRTALLRAIGPPDARTSSIRQLSALLDQQARGREVAVLSTRIGDAFPLVLDSGVGWALRTAHLWCVAAVYRGDLQSSWPLRFHPASEMGSAERRCLRMPGEDLRRNQPVLLLVRQPLADGPESADLRIDNVSYLSLDPTFAREFQHYRFAGVVDEFRVYERVLN
jgi:hypothetical protein